MTIEETKDLLSRGLKNVAGKAAALPLAGLAGLTGLLRTPVVGPLTSLAIAGTSLSLAVAGVAISTKDPAFGSAVTGGSLVTLALSMSTLDPNVTTNLLRKSVESFYATEPEKAEEFINKYESVFALKDESPVEENKVVSMSDLNAEKRKQLITEKLNAEREGTDFGVSV